jgi:hypothetical protein
MGKWMYRPTFSWPPHWLGVSGQFHAPGSFNPGERAPGTHWIDGWMDRRAGLDDMKWKFLTLQGLELRPLGRPASSQFLMLWQGNEKWFREIVAQFWFILWVQWFTYFLNIFNVFTKMIIWWFNFRSMLITFLLNITAKNRYWRHSRDYCILGCDAV